MLPRFVGLLMAFLLAGCATPSPFTSEKPAQPSALLADSLDGGANGAAFFMVTEVDGTSVGSTALSKSRQRSTGLGAMLLPQGQYRYVPAGRHKLKLVGQYGFAAPIQTLFRKEASYQVAGEIDVELQPGVDYKATGVLTAARREIWLEQTDTGAVVGKKIINTEDTLKEAALMATADFTCCNLHYRDGWISDRNQALLPFFPAGSRMVVTGYGRNRVHVLIDGREMTLGLDYGRGKESLEQFAAKLLAKDDPGPKIAAYPAKIRDAIRQAKVAHGMTREQALIALGYPMPDETPSLDSSTWYYYTANKDQFWLEWGPDGTVRDIRAEEETVLQEIVIP